MSTAGAGLGGRRGFEDCRGFGCYGGFGALGGFTARKRRNDEEAGGSALRPPVLKRQSTAGLQHRRDAKLTWFYAKEAATIGDVAAAARVLTLLQ
ncbi:hypothetical protein D1007_19651 [Hordeum vulgare]|nr:hypothetical protein D1007_19651 [Hordeum vulgare]